VLRESILVDAHAVHHLCTNTVSSPSNIHLPGVELDSRPMTSPRYIREKNWGSQHRAIDYSMLPYQGDHNGPVLTAHDLQQPKSCVQSHRNNNRRQPGQHCRDHQRLPSPIRNSRSGRELGFLPCHVCFNRRVELVSANRTRIGVEGGDISTVQCPLARRRKLNN
jgi:hypothetical protein